jgi:hypothetical protein
MPQTLNPFHRFTAEGAAVGRLLLAIPISKLI